MGEHEREHAAPARRFARAATRRGATMIEYALLLSVICIFCIAAIQQLVMAVDHPVGLLTAEIAKPHGFGPPVAETTSARPADPIRTDGPARQKPADPPDEDPEKLTDDEAKEEKEKDKNKEGKDKDKDKEKDKELKTADEGPAAGESPSDDNSPGRGNQDRGNPSEDDKNRLPAEADPSTPGDPNETTPGDEASGRESEAVSSEANKGGKTDRQESADQGEESRGDQEDVAGEKGKSVHKGK